MRERGSGGPTEKYKLGAQAVKNVESGPALQGINKSCCLRIIAETAQNPWLEECLEARNYPLALDA
jgi:hypothetical protein